MRKQKTKGRSLRRNNRTGTTYVSAWTLHLTITLHILLVTYKKVKQHYCPFKSRERELNNFFTTSQRLCQRGAQMVDVELGYSQTAMGKAPASENIGHLVCSQSLLEDGAVS